MSQVSISWEITQEHIERALDLVHLIDANLVSDYHYRDDEGNCLRDLDQVIIAIEAGKFLGDSNETEIEKSRGRNASKGATANAPKVRS